MMAAISSQTRMPRFTPQRSRCARSRPKLNRLGVVLWHAQALGIHNAKVVLGVGDSGVPLIGKRTIKPQRSREVASVASYRGIL